MSFEFSPKQKEYMLNAYSRWNLKCGAVRSGKSYVDIAYIIPRRLRAVRKEPGLNVILGVSKETIERNVLQPMREIYTNQVVGTINSRNIATVCGVPVYCLGASKTNQVSILQGMSIKYCYGDEIAKWSEPVFEMLKSRLDKPYSCFDGACNPEYPSHWLKQFIDDENVDNYVQKYTLFDNPFLPKNFVEQLCNEYRGTVYYNRLILGEWTQAEGLIYPMYQDCKQEPPKDWKERARKLYLAIDYGTLNAFAALLWAIVDGVAYAVDGYYYSGRNEGKTKTDDEYLKDVIAQFGQYGNEWQRLKIIIDPSAASFIAALRRTHIFSVIPADNAVKDGIRETASAMMQGKIKIAPWIKDWFDEAGGYVWADTDADDVPVKVNDHCLTGDTLVLTDKGEKPISELVGTSGYVWSYNTNSKNVELKRYTYCRKTVKNAKCIVLKTKSGRKIKCTPDHPILTVNGNYIEAEKTFTQKIIVGFNTYNSMPFWSIDEVIDIQQTENEDVYNLEVADNHNFIANGIVVHNCMDATRYFVKTTNLVKPGRFMN